MRVLFRRMPPPDQSGKYRTDVEPRQYEWLLSGNRERLTESPWKDESKELQGTLDGALPKIPQWDSFDGLIGYHVDYWPKTPEKISTIYRMHACPETLRNCWIPVYLGIRLPYAAMQLNDLLQTPGTVLIGQDKVDELACLHLEEGVPITGWLTIVSSEPSTRPTSPIPFFFRKSAPITVIPTELLFDSMANGGKLIPKRLVLISNEDRDWTCEPSEIPPHVTVVPDTSEESIPSFAKRFRVTLAEPAYSGDFNGTLRFTTSLASKPMIEVPVAVRESSDHLLDVEIPSR